MSKPAPKAPPQNSGSGSRRKLPKGAYRLPTGGYVVEGPLGPPNKRGKRIHITAVHRDEPDVDKVAQALIALAIELQKRQPEDLRRPGGLKGKPASGKTRRK